MPLLVARRILPDKIDNDSDSDDRDENDRALYFADNDDIESWDMNSDNNSLPALVP